ncbi:MAG: HAD family hydrolase [Rhodocyclaceae bacterium]|nr:HAD family hydrolase [Rhodocyclaceae bacterium]
MRDTIIFDFDGTLIDSAPGILATYAEVFSVAGLTPAVPLDATLIGPPLQPTMAKLLGEALSNSDPALLEKLVADFKPRYATTGVARTPAYPDADHALRLLREHGYTLYLATNKRASPTLALLEKFGWQQHFRRVYCIDSQLPAFADKTAMLRQLLAENALAPERCLYIGDTRGDYLSASACSIEFAAALWGYEDWNALADKEPMLRHASASLAELPRRLQAGATITPASTQPS